MSARPTIRLARGEQFRQPEETLSGGAVHQGDVMSDLTPPNSVPLIGKLSFTAPPMDGASCRCHGHTRIRPLIASRAPRTTSEVKRRRKPDGVAE